MNQLVALLCILPISMVVAYVPCVCRKVDGGLTEWTQYTPCSASCGSGTQTRERFCAAPYAQFGGKDCSGPLKQTKPCNLRPCPRNGGWGAWVVGTCSKKCGGGVKINTRTCNKPTPSKCGKDCTGKKTSAPTPCNVHRCPIWKDDCSKCQWNLPITRCSKKCRTRCFDHQNKKVADKHCKGSPVWKEKDCPTKDCPVIYKWVHECAGQITACRKHKITKDCVQDCEPTCVNAHTGHKVHDKYCKDPKITKIIACNDKKGCAPDPPTSICGDCKAKALKKALTYPDQHRQKTFVGLACRDSEIQADLHAFCKANKNKQSKNGGLPAKDWFWVHCSADGPWCKPCAIRGLVFNTKCDACEATRDGPCTGTHSG